MKRLQTQVLVAVVVLAAATGALAGDKLFMWQVESETAKVTLVGSIHVGKPDFFPLAEPFEKSFAEAATLAVEVDVEDPEVMQKSATLMMQKGMLPGDETLATRLEPEVYARLVEHAEKSGTNLDMYEKFRPGIVAMVMVMEEYQRQGFDPTLGIDKHFLDAARSGGKEIRQLETIEDQLELFFKIDDKLDDVLIAELLDQMEDLAALTDEMVSLWKSGDAEGLDRLLQENMGEGPEMEAFYREILDDRNVAMVEKIDAMLKEDVDVFVVVGAGHFGGEMGIVKLLEGKGHEVRQIED
jgi:uncharacterized protein YbaP (TraB family)